MKYSKFNLRSNNAKSNHLACYQLSEHALRVRKAITSFFHKNTFNCGPYLVRYDVNCFGYIHLYSWKIPGCDWNYQPESLFEVL